MHRNIAKIKFWLINKYWITYLKNKNQTYINLIICFLAIISYWLIGKPIALGFQVLVSIILIINWQKKFKNWLFIAYPIFGIFLTTFFGIKLSLTDNQIWHIFIGPSGSISVLTFYIVLCSSRNKLKRSKLWNFNYFQNLVNLHPCGFTYEGYFRFYSIKALNKWKYKYCNCWNK